MRKGAPQRKTYSVRIQEGVIDSLRHLAVDEHIPLSELLEEAIVDVVAKRRGTPRGGDRKEGSYGLQRQE
jgi:hypothetical protein